MSKPGAVETSAVSRFIWAAVLGLWYLGIVAAALFPAITVVSLIAPPAATFELPLFAAVDASGVMSTGGFSSQGGHIGIRIVRFENPVVSGTMADLTMTTRLLLLGMLASGITAFLLILYSLKGLLASIGKGEPFDPANSKRLVSIGAIVIVAGPFMGFLHYLVARSLANSSEAFTSLQPKLDVHLVAVLLGIIVVIIGKAFELGSRLQIEHDLTI